MATMKILKNGWPPFLHGVQRQSAVVKMERTLKQQSMPSERDRKREL